MSLKRSTLIPPLEEADPEAAKRTQADRLILHRFDKVLGIPPDTYRASIPDVPGPPSGDHRRRFPIPVLIDPRLTFADTLRIARIRWTLRGPASDELLGKREALDYASDPYWIWVGVYQQTVKKALQSPIPGGRWLTATEGVFLLLHHRNWASYSSSGISFPGSAYSVESGDRVVPAVHESAGDLLKDVFDFGFASQVLRKDAPGVGLRVEAEPIDAALTGASNPAGCAWPPDFDWNSITEPVAGFWQSVW